ncbi:hypothetical protein J6590_082406, partial [Homalodisca vitripennis]
MKFFTASRSIGFATAQPTNASAVVAQNLNSNIKHIILSINRVATATLYYDTQSITCIKLAIIATSYIKHAMSVTTTQPTTSCIKHNLSVTSCNQAGHEYNQLHQADNRV